MPSSPELLRYFVAEAGECLDVLEPLVAVAIGPAGGGSVVSAARALRGTATIARVPSIADLAFALERVGGGIRDSELEWTPELGDALRGAVREVRELVGSAQSWGKTESLRIASAEASVRTFIPNAGRHTPPIPGTSTQPVFVALQAAAIASDLDALIQATDRRTVLHELLSRVRIMQGVAGLRDYPPLAEVCSAIERAARGTMPDDSLSESESELFVSAAVLLRRSSHELRSRVAPLPIADRNAPEDQRFAAAVVAVEPPPQHLERVVQIEELFYQDAGPHVLTRSSVPPATPDRRFADEVVSRAEHVRRLIADARLAGDSIARQRIRRDLNATLDALEATARSFGAAQLAALCGDAARRTDLLSPLELDALDTAAALMLSPVSSIDDLERRVAVLTRRQHTPPMGQRAAVSRGATVTPTGRALQDLLASGLAGLRALDDQPFVEQDANQTEEDVVPVESLFFRGRAALLRAIQVRDAMRTKETPDAESLRELYDLLDLARTE